MKYLISESQYKNLVEQWYNDPKHPEYRKFAPTNYEKREQEKSKQILDKFGSVDPHTYMTILQIATAFVPVVGPFISAGIGLADAAMYYNEGDKKTAGLVGVFAMLPGVGSLASKLGLGKWTAKALGEIGKKISLGSKLSPLEMQVVERVAQNEKLIKTEIELAKKNISNVGKKQVVQDVSQEFLEGSLNSFKNQMKSKFPMTEKEATEFLQNYNKAGKDFRKDFHRLKFGTSQDNVWIATVLKNEIKPPVGKYLYHGTSSTNLENLAKHGLDNSLGKTANYGSMPTNLGKGVTTATGNIDSAITYSKLTANSTKGKDVIVRFPNSGKHNMGFFDKHDAVDPKLLEYSFDGGLTWTKSIK